jgi:hypothetical protein
MLNLMVGCLSRLQKKMEFKKSGTRVCPFFQMAEYEILLKIGAFL